MRYPVLFVGLICLCLGKVHAQPHQIGIPPITNYSKQDYHAETQNWSIAQDKRGIMYFGNNQGLLEFDGSSWRTFPLPNKSVLRSIKVGASGKIYAGGQNDLGCFQADNNGDWTFQSFKSSLPDEHQLFEDVWKTFPRPEGTYWCTQKKIFLKKKDDIKVILPTNRFDNFFFVDGNLYINEKGIGISKYEAGKLNFLRGTELFANMEVKSIIRDNSDKLLVFTTKNGIYSSENDGFVPWGEGIGSYLQKNRIYSAIRLQNEWFAIGTSQNGLLITDKRGFPIRIINKATGLPTNSILSMFEDQAGNLWLGLDIGLSHIEIQSPFSFIDARLGIDNPRTGRTYVAVDPTTWVVTAGYSQGIVAWRRIRKGYRIATSRE